jgi:hypothetical protein
MAHRPRKNLISQRRRRMRQEVKSQIKGVKRRIVEKTEQAETEKEAE